MYPEKKYSDTDAVETERESKMTTESMQLAIATEELLRYSERLERKLQGVMGEQPESVNEGRLMEPLPQRLEEIRISRQRVETANYMLKSILSRLEV